MRENNPKPALRISHIVYGRMLDRGRVKYIVDPVGKGDEIAIPEEVVLRRWRRRRFPGFVFSGERLSATVWRAIPALLGSDPARWTLLSLSELQDILESRRRVLREQHLTAPAAVTLRALFQVCTSDRLTALTARHGDPDRRGRSGVPDLFLYARNAVGQPCIARFVEVKKPEEAVSQDQIEEVAFMRRLGLHARVLRLIERELR